jgi:hypothetical protein
MAINLQVDNAVTTTAQSVKDQNGHATALALSTENVGIGTAHPTQRLTLGSGNVFLPYVRGALDGNLFFGGDTDKSQVGMRLSAIDAAGQFQCGFIDVRAGTVTDGLRIRVDTDRGAIEQMRITAGGYVGIGTPAPSERLEVNGNLRVTGTIAAAGDIQLTNADCAEDFDIAATEHIEPGTVMVLGQDGTLHQSQTAYDKRVVGVVSGAGSYQPGIVLDRQECSRPRKPIALIGKVFCKVDAQYGAIEIGDLLTTSSTPGHSMKAADPVKAFGSVIGKALSPLSEGKGLIPVLIALQ